MSDDNKDKPFPPSAEKLRQAREDGEAPQYSEVSSAVAFSFGILASFMALPNFLNAWKSLLSAIMLVVGSAGLTSADMLSVVKVGSVAVVKSCALVLIFTALISLLVRRLLVGPIFSAKAVTPDFKRLNPISGLQNIFRLEAIFKIGMAAFTLVTVCTASYFYLQSHMQAIFFPKVPWDVAVVFSILIWRLAMLAAVVFLCFAILDTFFQKARFMGRYRMDIKDLRDEHKQQEGDPSIKHKRRAEHQYL